MAKETWLNGGSFGSWGTPCDHADAVAASIGDENSAGAVPGTVHSRRRAETRVAGRPAIPGKRLNPVTSKGGDDAGGGIHPADAKVANIGDEELPSSVYREPTWIVQACHDGREAIARIGRHSVASHGGTDSGSGVHTADAKVAPISDEHVAAGIRGQSTPTEGSLRSGCIVSQPIGRVAASGHRGDLPRLGIDSADAAIVAVISQ